MPVVTAKTPNQPIPEGDGFFTIRDVPIFREHEDRGFLCDSAWLLAAVQNFEKQRASGYRPMIIIGHNTPGVEKESVGFLDNLKVVGKELIADLVRVPEHIAKALKRNAYPNRSVEILPKSKRILALALLGGTTPHFALPQLAYGTEELSVWYRSPFMFNTGQQNANQGALTREDVASIVKEAMQQYSQQQQQEEEPAIYNLNSTQAMQFYQDHPDLPLMQDAEGKPFFYSEDEHAVYYAPAWLAAMLARGGAAARTARAAVRHPGGAAVAARKGAMKGGRRAAAAAGGAGRAAGRGLRTTAGVGLAAGAAGLGAGAGLGAAVARRQQEQFQLDEQGLVYDAAGNWTGYGLDANGEVVQLYEGGDAVAPDMEYEELPPADTVDPQLSVGAPGFDADEMTGLETDPGGLEDVGTLVDVDREESDQFAHQPDEDQVRLYRMEQELRQLQTANALIQEGRKAEQYKAYLEAEKKKGTPINNIEQTVDFMMGLTEEQVKAYKTQLEAQPKIQLGRMEQYQQTATTTSDQEIATEYSQHKEIYQNLGVREEDLKYARYVRSNGQ